MHVVVTGGTGLIGTALVPMLLDAGHHATVVSRSPEKASKHFGGRVKGCTIDTLPETFDGAINLAGATLDKRWTPAWKRVIRDSRVNYTKRIRQAAENCGAKVLVSGSAINYYDEAGDTEITEATPPGTDYLAGVCVDWEKAALSNSLRVTLVRTGIVIGKRGGALGKMLLPFKMGIGGRLGNGRQWWPWILLEDAARMFLWALEDDTVSGPVNGTSPSPVTNLEFTKTLGRVLGRPTILPVPAFMIRILFGEMADVILASVRGLPKRTQELGFKFKYPELEEALRAELLGDTKTI